MNCELDKTQKTIAGTHFTRPGSKRGNVQRAISDLPANEGGMMLRQQTLMNNMSNMISPMKNSGLTQVGHVDHVGHRFFQPDCEFRPGNLGKQSCKTRVVRRPPVPAQ